MTRSSTRRVRILLESLGVRTVSTTLISVNHWGVSGLVFGEGRPGSGWMTGVLVLVNYFVTGKIGDSVPADKAPSPTVST